MTNAELDEYLKSIGGLIDAWSSENWTSSANFDINEGWNELVKNCIAECIAAGWDRRVFQIKQKFGELRFYISEAPDAVHNIIDKYESLSRHTCEICGKEGQIKATKTGWLFAVCPEHIMSE